MNNKTKSYLIGFYGIYWILTFAIERIKELVTNPLDIFVILFKKIFTISSILLFINDLYLILFLIIGIVLLEKIIKKKVLLKKILTGLLVSISALLYHFQLFLILYKKIKELDFDFYFFWYNKSVTLITIWRIFPWLVIIITLSIIITTILWYFILKPVKKINNKMLIYISILFLVSILFQGMSFKEQQNAIVAFALRSISNKNTIVKYYYNKYHEYLNTRNSQTFSLSKNASLDKLGKHIFIVHFESLSEKLANETNAPNFLKAGKEGLYFPKFYGSSVQTIRAEESILCGLPPTIRNILISDVLVGDIEKTACLPRILADEGYKTIFMKNDYLEFAHTDKFMPAVGFQELHNRDIMQPNDPEFEWGFREDIFFQRILEYLEQYKDEKTFVYIALSATNHVPFHNQDTRYESQLPYPNPKNVTEKVSNTTYLQDLYFGEFFDAYEKNYADDSTLILTSDHAWAPPIHIKNIHDENGAYEENFLIPFAYIPPKNINNTFAIGKTIEKRYGQVDIMPTIIQMLDPQNTYPLIGESFYDDLINSGGINTKKSPVKISTQPFGGGFISLIDFPTKYLFKSEANEVEIFDLLTDPQEQSPNIHPDVENYLYLIDEYFKIK